MSHARKIIRDELKTILTGLTTTGTNIFFDTIYNIKNDQVPALLIFTKNETVENKTIGQPRIEDRILYIDIIGLVKTTIDYQDTCDQIALEVENAINSSLNLNGKAKYIILNDIDTEYNDDLEKPLGSIKLGYSVMYRVNTNNLEVISN